MDRLTQTHLTPAQPAPVIAIDCPWCERTMLVGEPIGDAIRCAECAIEVELAPAVNLPRGIRRQKHALAA